MDILKEVTNQLGSVITDASFEGANIVLYTDNENFFKNGISDIKKVVNNLKKRIDLRAEETILMSEEKARKEIEGLIPKDAGIEAIFFDSSRGVVIIEAKRPGLVIGREGSILEDLRRKTLWVPNVRRSPEIKSKITESIRSVLYANNDFRRKFLNEVGKKIYSSWNKDQGEEWVRVSFLGGARQVGRSSILLQTPNSRVLLDCGINVAAKGEEQYPYFKIPEFDISKLDAIIISHAHLDHVALVPYLYKMGYKGPVYMTEPTRDIAALLALDLIGVNYKQAKAPLFNSKDIKEMVKHSITLNFNGVTDITPDVRLTFYNSGHCLGSSMIHLNIGNGLHNLVYTGDFKYLNSKLLNKASSDFPRVESIITESTYGSKNDVLPTRKESDDKLLDVISKTLKRGGKVLIPELGLGRAQETMLILEEAMKSGRIEKVPVYIDGMIWDINAIHTTYPSFLNSNLKFRIFRGDNPFLSPIFSRVGSMEERKLIMNGGPSIVLATSGMLVGGASVEYLKNYAENKNNSIIFVCYQGVGSVGRDIQDGRKEIKIDSEGTEKVLKINLEVNSIIGLTAHPGRSELISFFNNLKPRPKRILINHGEISKSMDLASSLYKMTKTETTVPRIMDSVRLR